MVASVTVKVEYLPRAYWHPYFLDLIGRGTISLLLGPSWMHPVVEQAACARCLDQGTAVFGPLLVVTSALPGWPFPLAERADLGVLFPLPMSLFRLDSTGPGK